MKAEEQIDWDLVLMVLVLLLDGKAVGIYWGQKLVLE